MVSKKKIKFRKRFAGFINRPLICKIEISEHGRRVLDYKGDIKNGFKKFKGLAEDVYQVVDKEEDTNATK